MIFEIDAGILLWIQEFVRNDVLTPIMIFITHLGDHGRLWILISFLLLIPKKTRKIGMICVISLIGSYLINNVILKNLIGRIRPYEAIEQLTLLIEKQKDLSFPSGHAASSFSVAIVLFKKLPRPLGICSIILALLISVSRMYVGVHYPSDVIFGVISGCIIGLLSIKLVDSKTWNDKKFLISKKR